MKITMLGIDLAKNIFQLYGIDGQGQTVVDRSLSRSKLPVFIANLSKCTIFMEACGGSNYWGRKFRSMGHDVKLISPQHVKPFVGRQKNDRNDARAIVEAGRRLEAKFVAIKEVWHQDIQVSHRIRERLLKNQISLSNQIRGILLEFGLVIPQGKNHVRENLYLHLENADNELSEITRNLLLELHHELLEIDKRFEKMTKHIIEISKNSEVCQRLETIKGVGPIVSTAFWASIADPRIFTNGRQASAWIGLVPKQNSSGGHTRLTGITKTGQTYLRKIIVQGARAAVMAASARHEKTTDDIKTLAMVERRGFNKTAVALANRNVRRMWALMAN